MKNISICSLFAVARIKTEAAMSVPAAALWSGMTSDQNIPAEGRKLSGLEMQHDDGGGARGRGQHCSLHQHTEISLHLQEAGRPTPALVKHYPCNSTSPSPAFLTHTQIKHSAFKKLIISIQFPCSEGVATPQ